MFGSLYKMLFKAIFGLILVINLTEAKFGAKLVGAGLLLNSLTKSMIIPLPVPLPLQIVYGPGPAVIQSKPQLVPIPHPIPIPIPIRVNIPDHKQMERRTDPMNPKPFDPYCNYMTLSNVDSKIILREPLPTVVNGRTIMRYCQQPVPKVNSGKYDVLFRGNQKSSFGSIRVSIKL